MPEPMTLAEAMLHLGKANHWLERHESGVWAVYKFDEIFDQIDTTATGATWPEVVSAVLNRKVVERDVTAELVEALREVVGARTWCMTEATATVVYRLTQPAVDALAAVGEGEA